MDGVIQNVAHIHVVISSRQKHQSEIPTMNILEIVSAVILAFHHIPLLFCRDLRPYVHPSSGAFLFNISKTKARFKNRHDYYLDNHVMSLSAK